MRRRAGTGAQKPSRSGFPVLLLRGEGDRDTEILCHLRQALGAPHASPPLGPPLSSSVLSAPLSCGQLPGDQGSPTPQAWLGPPVMPVRCLHPNKDDRSRGGVWLLVPRAGVQGPRPALPALTHQAPKEPPWEKWTTVPVLRAGWGVRCP